MESVTRDENAKLEREITIVELISVVSSEEAFNILSSYLA
jgi:hypothetical protein